MSIQLQIAIPVLVTAVALLGIALLRRYFRPEVLVITAVALALGGWMTKSHLDIQHPESEKERKASYSSLDISLALANGYMLEDHQEEAAKILKELSHSHGDDPQVLLAMARSYALRKNYREAAQLYAQTDIAPGKEQTGAVELAANISGGEGAVAHYLTQWGMDPGEYGVSAESYRGRDEDGFRELVLEGVEKSGRSDSGKNLSRAVEAAVEITGLYHRPELTEEERLQLEEAVGDLNRSFREEPGLAKNPHLRLARMQGLLAMEDYKALAQCADDAVTIQELLVLAQLYTNGQIRDKDFPDGGMAQSTGKQILDLCNNALNACEDALTPEQAEYYEQELEKLENRIENPGLYTMTMGLQEQTAGGDDALDSKAYLALAKLEEHSGNTDLAQEYIGKALQTSGNSDDDAYRAAMNQLGNVVSGDSGGDVKQVDQYVDQALENSLPEQISLGSSKTPDAAAPEADPFATVMAQNINQSTAILNIGYIHKDEFPKVSARVQIQSPGNATPEQIRQNLRVYDCGSRITEFTLDRMEFERSRIILLCDVSGSMSGSEEQLKQAIIAFAEQMQPGEEVCVIGFSYDVVFVHEFSADKEKVKGFAESIFANGGTALYPSVLEAGELIPMDPLSNNVIIAMTDGQDGSPATEGKMRNFIGAMAAQKEVTLYTVGLGADVDTQYLQTMASAGNGSFLYASSIEQLQAFYDFIHGQLHNQYNLTYTAKNTTKNQRLLEIAMEGEVGTAQKTYYLVDPDYSDKDMSAYNPYVVEDTDTTIYGLATKFVYKSSMDRKLKLAGEGFDPGDDVTIRIIGNVEYTLTAEYVDANTYEINLPAEVCVGVYDLSVSIGDESVKLEKELTVAIPGNQTTFRFGSYCFTALSGHREGEDRLVLSGNVMLNGWLFFKGDVIIEGKVTDERIRVTDTSGAYMCYNIYTAQGLAKNLAGLNIPIALDAMGTFQLYSDPYTPGEMDKFRVQEIDLLWQLNVVFLKVENPRLAIYPDALEFQVPQIELKLPLQKQVLRNFSAAKKLKLETEADILFTATQIAMTGELELSADRSDKKELTMVSLPLRFNEMKLKIDTLKNDYELELDVNLKLGQKSKDKEEGDGYKLSFAIKDGRFDALGLQIMDKKATLVYQPVPVDIGDFGFEVAGFSKYDSDDAILSNLLNTEIKIKFKVEVAALDHYLPGIEEILDKGDISLASMEDCELSLKLKEFCIDFTAKVKFCSLLEIGSCKISLGRFDYTNMLIGFYNEAETGLSASVTLGSEWKTKNVKLKLTGRAELTLGVPYSGLWLDGDIDFDIGWWLLHGDVDVTGDALIGLYENSSGNLQFSIIVKGSNPKGQTSGVHVYITKTTGLGMYSY